MRTNPLAWTEAKAMDSLTELDKEGPGYLGDLFDKIVVDEAHSIKNGDTMSHCAITWLNVKFVIIAPATFLPKRIGDFNG